MKRIATPYKPETVYAGLFRLVPGTAADPDFSWPLHEAPCRIEIRHHTDKTMTIHNQHIILKFKVPAPYGYVYSIYRKTGENLYGEMRTGAMLQGQTFFITVRSAILRKA